MMKPVTHHDRGKILGILRQTGVFTRKEIAVAMEIVDQVLAKRDGGDYQVFSYYDSSGQLVGYICFGPIPMTDSGYDLYWIAVDNCVRGRGVAAELVAFMEKQVARQGGGKIYVDTASTPLYAAARAFYEKQGYALLCTLNDFYREGDHKVTFAKSIDKLQK